MFVSVGCEFQYESTTSTASIWQIRPRADGHHRLLREDFSVEPNVPHREYRDGYGNVCDRLTLPAEPSRVHYRALVEVDGQPDEEDTGAEQLPVEELPDEALVYLLPSRYCVSDLLYDTAWELFASTKPGWERVQGVCDWVHDHLTFGYGASTTATSALDVYHSRTGVCRDFAQLAVTFCRALGIPARYAFGYLPDIGVPPPDDPMDFVAWFEVYLGGRWWTFDPRNNQRRIGRVLIGRGRDALDVAMVTTYGPAVLTQMLVIAEEAAEQTPSGPGD